MATKKHKNAPLDKLRAITAKNVAQGGAIYEQREKFVPRTLVELRPDLVPDILRPAKNYKPEPFDVSFISETPTTITIRHRDGEILTVDKTPYAEVVKRLKREKAKAKRSRKPVDTSGSLR